MTAVRLRRPSLTGRLLSALVGSLVLVAVALGAGGALFIGRVAEQTSDRLLGASPRAIAETLAVQDGRITLDLPPSALSMLETPAQDNVYYSVWHGNELLTGYGDLPRPAADTLTQEGESFRYATYRGLRVRIAAETRRAPPVKGLVLVEVAETLGARHALARNMLAGLSMLEAAFVAMAAMLVWPTLHWTLRPLTELRRQMDVQPTGSGAFTPLTTDRVPVELLGLVGGFNALLDRLDAGVERMRAFTADASHQMRTPLAVLRTHIAVLRPHVKRQGLEALDDVEQAAERLQHLLTSLIVLARADGTVGAQQLRGAADLRQVAARVVADLEDDAVEAGVCVQVKATGACLAAADPLVTAEILKNLLDNAIKYNRAGGQVLVTLDEADGRVALGVEDDGPGIPAEHHERVFQRFYRLSRDQHRPGSGLGLPIVSALTGTLGGEVRLASRADGVGLRVIVSIPTAPPRASGGLVSRRESPSAGDRPGRAPDQDRETAAQDDL